jgi:hypothetical protein
LKILSCCSALTAHHSNGQFPIANRQMAHRNLARELTAASTLGSLDINHQGKNSMAVNSIQLGQVWRSDADGQDYLVTKVYNEVFTQYAMLRPAGITAPEAPTVRVKVAKSPQGASLPGYAFTQEGSF